LPHPTHPPEHAVSSSWKQRGQRIVPASTGIPHLGQTGFPQASSPTGFGVRSSSGIYATPKSRIA
jgi:hypothetical protein